MHYDPALTSNIFAYLYLRQIYNLPYTVPRHCELGIILLSLLKMAYFTATVELVTPWDDIIFI